ncbi:hypothetical protein PROFUN_08815 [Planoprotostelium fungivorum]|uniref:Tyrosyl-DNA phosphodiesterase 1 n=1 Tax=Planoprotostelium fungivorum TaxID=1890364 RepID=A0A2P6MVS9_9EUKA|nr:hypothetical protein PROFUN_08815 [Planoprotostelium fungivorum]
MDIYSDFSARIAVGELTQEEADYQLAILLSQEEEINRSDVPHDRKRRAEVDLTTLDDKQPRLSSVPLYRFNSMPGLTSQGNAHSIRLKDIFSTEEEILSVLLTTYMLDLDWLLETIPLLTMVPLTVVHGMSNIQAFKRDKMTVHCPPLPLSYGTNHGKMFAIFYENKVRIAISTANLVAPDYDRKTQGIWMEDFSRKKEDSPPTSAFEETITDYVRRIKADPKPFSSFDFSSSKVILITSVPGHFQGESLDRYGHMALRKALSRENFQGDFSSPHHVCQFSSMGSITEDWINEEFRNSMWPHHLITREKKGKKKDNTTQVTGVQLVWPTVSFVRDSNDGWNSGGGLCFPQKNDKAFFKERGLMHRYRPLTGRERVAPHIKTFATFSNDYSRAAWIAWGSLQKNGSQIMIRNYEIGVLFLPSRYGVEHFETAVSPEGSTGEWLALTPYQLPTQRYESSDRPWLWDVSYDERDSRGATFIAGK